MSDVYAAVSFGAGRRLRRPAEHPVLEAPLWRDLPAGDFLQALAREQLGTVGGGNHYVDLLVEVTGVGEAATAGMWEAAGAPVSDRTLRMANVRRLSEIPADAPVWVAVHFGSRGAGFHIANGFMNLAENLTFGSPRGDSQSPILIDAASDLGQAYLLRTTAEFTVDNHHNFAWREIHDGRPHWVVRKGATPLFPGQHGFIGGSMGDVAVVVRGGEADEAPQVYRKLADVLDHHAPTFDLLHVLRPVAMAMAGSDEQDPYKD